MFYEDHISVATPEGVTLEVTLAGVGSRFVAAAVDQLLRSLVLLALFLALLLLGSSGDTSPVTTGGSDMSAGVAIAGILVVTFLVQFGYDVMFETLASGRTPGKRWAGLRVVRADGAPVGFVTSALRNVLRLVDILPGFYGVGIVAVLATPRNQRLGDLAAGTLVVRERRGRRPAAPAPPPAPAVAPPETSTWDVSSVTDDELATVRRFLDRRPTLTDDARRRLAGELAARLRPKVAGPSDQVTPEPFLEALVAVKASRS